MKHFPYPIRDFSLAYFAVVFSLSTAACLPPPRAPRATPYAVLRVECTPADAEVWMDNRYLRQAQDFQPGGLRIAPGPHQIEIRHANYHSSYFEVDIKEKGQFRLKLSLAERLP